jgi:signal transduction histidine kinase/CheY-like chemotaxis protein
MLTPTPNSRKKQIIEQIADKFAELDYTPIGQIIVDCDYTVLFWNRVLESWTSIHRHEILGQDLLSFFPRLREDKFHTPLTKLFEQGGDVVFSAQTHKYSIAARLADSSFRIQQTFVTRIPAITPREFCLLFSIQDETSINNALANSRNALRKLNIEINERKKFEQRLEHANIELKVAKEEAESATRVKSEFLANMSHELRSPLNSMLILSKLLADNHDKNLTSKQVEFADTVNSSGQHLLTLINDLLDLSKVEAGRMELNLEIVNLAQLLDDMRLNYEQMASQKGLSFVTELAGGVPELIKTDYQRLDQILRNLISNSFKFTTEGEVSIKIGRPEPDVLLHSSGLLPSKTIAFSVCDTGIGIPASKLKLIFQSFSQADGSINRKYGGTGLGLSISREFSRFLGGEILVKSFLGKGSVFTLFLPQGDIEQQAGVPEKKVVPAKRSKKEILKEATERLKNHTVLIVDDEPRNLFTLKVLLEPRKMKILTAENGQECLNVLAKHPETDIILMDIMMPVMDGYEAIGKIRKMRDFADIPIVAVTAKAMASDRKICLDAGATDYLAKPVIPKKLLSRLLRWVPATKVKKIITSSDEEYRSPEKVEESASQKEQVEQIDPKAYGFLSGKKVIFLDTDMRNVFQCLGIFKKFKIKAMVAQDIEQCIAHLSKIDDIRMLFVDLDNINPEVIKTIRKHSRYSSLPIINISEKGKTAAESDFPGIQNLPKPLTEHNIILQTGKIIKSET